MLAWTIIIVTVVVIAALAAIIDRRGSTSPTDRRTSDGHASGAAQFHGRQGGPGSGGGG